MAGIGKDDNWQATQSGHNATPLDESHFAPLLEGVALYKVSDYQDNQVSDRYERNNAGVLERVKAAKERERYHDQPFQAPSAMQVF